ncbi:MAG: hypothetical protein GKR88_02090 [Flavobacteriaceae bacterium]|nr:MAG: hypothetical protein GKR88_02090 [Flavobacteriaceae bacterium]
MTTITIKKGKKLSQSVFETFEEFIDAYYQSTGKVILRNIDLDDLSEAELAAYKKHQEEGYDDFEDFRG